MSRIGVLVETLKSLENELEAIVIQCSQCGKSFTYGEVLDTAKPRLVNRFLLLSVTITCPYCGKEVVLK